jgi:two-component system, chemotaxis family, protein-glutamate methylesterase/glutaminase
MPNAPLSVLVVDDSAVVRQAFTAILTQDPAISVTVAADPYIAFLKMGHDRPDVILLDLELPRMDGFTFLRKLMAVDPIPVVVCSGFAARGTDTAIRALEEGAVEVLAKPQLGVRDFLHESAATLIDVVRGAATARVRRRPKGAATPAPVPRPAKPARPARTARSDIVVAIGASTGGTEALRQVLEAMPEDAPGIVIVQHMPERFTAAFAERLNQSCRIEVKEAAAGDPVVRGRALIAPGNRHLVLRVRGSRYEVELADTPPVSRHRPSVDVLFRSVAAAAGRHAVGAILTGMGADGAAGLLEMRRAGAATLAQDEATCVVFGMPKEAIACGAVEDVMPLSRIPGAVLTLAGRRPSAP